jgi:hypothetical protein
MGALSSETRNPELEFRLQHNEYRKRLQRRLRAARRARGRCADCNRKAAPQRAYCRKCLRARRRVTADRTAWCLANNVCCRCGDVKGKNAIKNYCRLCADFRAARAAKTKL